MSFTIVAAKSQDAAFRARLTVAITEHCRYTLGLAQGARSANRFAWDNALARSVLQLVASEPQLLRFARLCLLPSTWDSFNPDDDAQLLSRVGQYFTLFATDSPPA
jgi:hypothetical protein